jgi:hypothetical protein
MVGRGHCGAWNPSNESLAATHFRGPETYQIVAIGLPLRDSVGFAPWREREWIDLNSTSKVLYVI